MKFRSRKNDAIARLMDSGYVFSAYVENEILENLKSIRFTPPEQKE